MLCEECKKRQATVLIRKTVNNETSELHLCEHCAQDKGELNFIKGTEFSLHSLFASLLDSDKTMDKQLGLPYETKTKCPKCGISYEEFKETGRLGCNRCYETYRERLQPLLRRLHGQVQHTGKVPCRAGDSIRLKKELQELKEALQRAVEREEFERAAVLRDKIRDLEKRLG